MADLNPSFASDDNFRVNLFSPFVGGDPVLKGYRPLTPEESFQAGAQFASDNQGTYLGEAVKAVNVAGKTMTRDQLHNIEGGDELLYYSDKLASGSSRGAWDTMKESFTNPWRFIPYVSSLASVGGSVRSAVRAADTMEKLTGTGAGPDSLTDEERVALTSYIAQSDWESKSTFGSKLVDITTAMPAFAAEMGASSYIANAATKGISKLAPNFAARHLAANGAMRNMARSSSRTAIDAIKTLSANESALFGSNVDDAMKALKGFVAGSEDTAWGKAVLNRLASKDFVSQMYDDGAKAFTAKGRRFIKSLAQRATMDTKTMGRVSEILNDSNFNAKLTESITSKSVDKLRNLLTPFVNKATKESQLRLTSMVDDAVKAAAENNAPLALQTARNIVTEAAVSTPDDVAKRAAMNYISDYVDLSLNLGQSGPARQYLFHTLGWLRDHALRGAFEHYDVMDMVGRNAAGEIRNALGIMLIEAPIKGAIYTAIGTGVRVPASLMLTGRAQPLHQGELGIRGQAFLSQDPELMNKAFMLGLGQLWVEMASENVGEAFSAVGRSVLNRKWGSKMSLADRFRAYTDRHNVIDKFTKLDGQKAMTFRRWVSAFTGEESYNALAAEQYRHLAISRLLKNEKAARRVFGDTIPSMEEILANPAMKRRAVDAGKEYLRGTVGAKIIASDLMQRAVGKEWWHPASLLSPAKLHKTLKHAGFDGTIEEWLEERYGGFFDSLFGFNTTSEEDRAKHNALLQAIKDALPDEKSGFAELCAFMIPGVMTSTLNRAQAALGTGALSKFQNLMERLDGISNHSMAVIDGFDSQKEMSQIMEAARVEVQKETAGKGGNPALDAAAETAHKFIQQGDIVEGDGALGALIDDPGNDTAGFNAQRPISQDEIQALRAELADACKEYWELMRDTRWNTNPGWFVTALHKMVGFLTFATTGQFAALRWNPMQAMTQTWSDGRDVLIQGSRIYDEAKAEARKTFSRGAEADIIREEAAPDKAHQEGLNNLAPTDPRRASTSDTRRVGAEVIADRIYKENKTKIDALTDQIAAEKISQMLNRKFAAQGALRISMNGSIQSAAENLADERIADAKALAKTGAKEYTYTDELGTKTSFSIPTTEAETQKLRETLIKANRTNLAVRYLTLAATGKITYEAARDTYNTRIGSLMMTADAAIKNSDNGDVVIYRRHLDAALAATPEFRNITVLMKRMSLDDPIADRLADYGSSVNVSDILDAAKLTPEELAAIDEETARTDDRFAALSRFAYQMKYVHGNNPYAMRGALRQALKVSKMLAARYNIGDDAKIPRWVKSLPSGKRSVILQPKEITDPNAPEGTPRKARLTYYEADSGTEKVVELELKPGASKEFDQWVMQQDGQEVTMENLLVDAGYVPMRTQFIFAPCNTVSFSDPLIAAWSCYSTKEKLIAAFSQETLPFAIGDVFKDQATLLAYRKLAEEYQTSIDNSARAEAKPASEQANEDAAVQTFDFLGKKIDDAEAKAIVEGFERVEQKATELALTLKSRSAIDGSSAREYVVHVAAMSDSERVIIPFDAGTHGSAPSAITAAILRNRLLSYHDDNFGSALSDSMINAYNLTDVTLSFHEAAKELLADAKKKLEGYEAKRESPNGLRTEEQYNDALIEFHNLQAFANTYLRSEEVTTDFISHFLTNVVFLYGPHAKATGNWLAQQAMWGTVAEHWLSKADNYKHLLRMQLYANVLLNPAADIVEKDQIKELINSSFNVKTSKDASTGFLQSDVFKTFAAEVPNVVDYYSEMFKAAQSRASVQPAAQSTAAQQDGQASRAQEEKLTAEQIAATEAAALHEIIDNLAAINDGKASLTYALLMARRASVKGGDTGSNNEDSDTPKVTPKSDSDNTAETASSEDVTRFNELPLASRVAVAQVAWEILGAEDIANKDITLDGLLQHCPQLAAALSDGSDSRDLVTVQALNSIMGKNGLLDALVSKVTAAKKENPAADVTEVVQNGLEEIRKLWADTRQTDSLVDLLKYFRTTDVIKGEDPAETRARRDVMGLLLSHVTGATVEEADEENPDDATEDDADDAGADNQKDVGFDVSALKALEGMPEWKTVQFMMQSLFPMTRNNMAEAVKALIQEIDSQTPTGEKQVKAETHARGISAVMAAEAERKAQAEKRKVEFKPLTEKEKDAIMEKAEKDAETLFAEATSFRDSVLLAGSKWAQSPFVVARGNTVAHNRHVGYLVDYSLGTPTLRVLFSFLKHLSPSRYNKILAAMANIVPVSGVSTEVSIEGSVTLDDNAGGTLTTAPHAALRLVAAELKQNAEMLNADYTPTGDTTVETVLKESGVMDASPTIRKAIAAIKSAKKAPFAGLVDTHIRRGDPFKVDNDSYGVVGAVSQLIEAARTGASIDDVVEELLSAGSARSVGKVGDFNALNTMTGDLASTGLFPVILNAYAGTIPVGRKTYESSTTELNKGALSIAQQDFLEYLRDTDSLASLLGGKGSRNLNLRFCQWGDGSSIFTHVVSPETMGADFIVDAYHKLKAVTDLPSKADEGWSLSGYLDKLNEQVKGDPPVIHVQMYTGDRSTLSTMRLPLEQFTRLARRAAAEARRTKDEKLSALLKPITASNVIDVYYATARFILQKMGLGQIEAKRTQVVAAEQIQTSLDWRDTSGATTGETWRPPKMLCVLSPSGSNETLFGTGMEYTHSGYDPLLCLEPEEANTTKVHLVGRHGKPGDSVYEMVKGNFHVASSSNPMQYPQASMRYLHRFMRNYCEQNRIGRVILTDYDGIKVGPLAWKKPTIKVVRPETAQAGGETAAEEGQKSLGQLDDVVTRALANVLGVQLDTDDSGLYAEHTYDGKLGAFVQAVVAELAAAGKDAKFITDTLLSAITVNGQTLDKAMAGFAIVPMNNGAEGVWSTQEFKDAPQQFSISYDAQDFRALSAANLFHKAKPEAHPLAKNVCNDITALVATGNILGGRNGDLFRLLTADFPSAVMGVVSREGNREALLRGNEDIAKDLSIGGEDYSTAQEAELMFNSIVTKMVKPTTLRIKCVLGASHAKMLGFDGTLDANWTGDDAFYSSCQSGNRSGYVRANILDKRIRYGCFVKSGWVEKLHDGSFLLPPNLEEGWTIKDVIKLLASFDEMGLTEKDKQAPGSELAPDDRQRAAAEKEVLLSLFTDWAGRTMTLKTHGGILWGDLLRADASDEIVSLSALAEGARPTHYANGKPLPTDTEFYVPGTALPFPRTPSGNAGPVFTTLRLSTPATLEFTKDGYIVGADSIAVPPPDATLRQGSDHDGDTVMITLPFSGNKVICTKEQIEQEAKALREILGNEKLLEEHLTTDENGAVRFKRGLAQRFGALLSGAFNYISMERWGKDSSIGTDQWAVGTLDDATVDAMNVPNALPEGMHGDLTDVRTIAIVTQSGRNASVARGSIVAGVASLHTAAAYQFVPESLVTAEGEAKVPWATYDGFVGLIQYLDQYSNTLFDDLKEQLSWKLRLTPQTTDAFLGLIMVKYKTEGAPDGFKALCQSALEQFVNWVDGPADSGNRDRFSGIFGDAMMCALGLVRTDDHVNLFVAPHLADRFGGPQRVSDLRGIKALTDNAELWSLMEEAATKEKSDKDAGPAAWMNAASAINKTLKQAGYTEHMTGGMVAHVYKAISSNVSGVTVQDTLKSAFTRAAAASVIFRLDPSDFKKDTRLVDLGDLVAATSTMGTLHRFAAGINPYKATTRSSRVVTSAHDIKTILDDGTIIAQPEVRDENQKVVVEERRLGRILSSGTVPNGATESLVDVALKANLAVKNIAGRGTLDQTIVDDILKEAVASEGFELPKDMKKWLIPDGLRMAPAACAAHEWVRDTATPGVQGLLINAATPTGKDAVKIQPTEAFLRGVEGALAALVVDQNKIDDAATKAHVKTLLAYLNFPITSGQSLTHTRLSPSTTNISPGSMGRIHTAIRELARRGAPEVEIPLSHVAVGVFKIHKATNESVRDSDTTEAIKLSDLVKVLVEYSAITSRTRAISDAGAGSILDMFPLEVRTRILSNSGSQFNGLRDFLAARRENSKLELPDEMGRFIKKVCSVAHRTIGAGIPTYTPYVNMDDVFENPELTARSAKNVTKEEDEMAKAVFSNWGRDANGNRTFKVTKGRRGNGLTVSVHTGTPYKKSGNEDLADIVYHGDVSWESSTYFPTYSKKFGSNSIPVAVVIDPAPLGTNDPTSRRTRFVVSLKLKPEDYAYVAPKVKQLLEEITLGEYLVTNPDTGVITVDTTDVNDCAAVVDILRELTEARYAKKLAEARVEALKESKPTDDASPLANNQPKAGGTPAIVTSKGTVTSAEKTKAIDDVLDMLEANSEAFIDKVVNIIHSRRKNTGRWNQKVLDTIMTVGGAPESPERQAATLRRLRDNDMVAGDGGLFRDHWDASSDDGNVHRGIRQILDESLKFAEQYFRDYLGVTDLSDEQRNRLYRVIRSSWIAGTGMKGAWRNSGSLELAMTSYWPSCQVVNLYFLEAMSSPIPEDVDAQESVTKYHQLTGREIAKKVANARMELSLILEKIREANPKGTVVQNTGANRYDASTYIAPVTYTIVNAILSEFNYFTTHGGLKEGDRKYAYENITTLLNLVSFDKNTPVSGIITPDTAQGNELSTREYIDAMMSALRDTSGQEGDKIVETINYEIRARADDEKVHRKRADGKGYTWDPFNHFGGGQVAHWKQALRDGLARPDGMPLTYSTDTSTFLFQPQTLALAALITRVTPFGAGAYSFDGTKDLGPKLLVNLLRHLVNNEDVQRAVEAVRDAFNSLCAYRGVINFTLGGPGATGVVRVTEDMLEGTMDWNPPPGSALDRLLALRDKTIKDAEETETAQLINYVGKEFLIENNLPSSYTDPDDNTLSTLLDIDPSAAFKCFSLPTMGHFDLRETMMYQTGEAAVMAVRDTGRFMNQLYGISDVNYRIPEVVIEKAHGIEYKEGTFQRGEMIERTKFIAPELVRFKFRGQRFTEEEIQMARCYARAVCAYALGGSNYLYSGVGNAGRFGYALKLTHEVLLEDVEANKRISREDFLKKYSKEEITKKHLGQLAGSGGTSGLSVWLHGLYRSIPESMVEDGFYEKILGIIFDTADAADRKHMNDPKAQKSNASRAYVIETAVLRALLDADLIRISDRYDNKGQPMTSVVVPVAMVRDKFMQSEAYKKLLRSGRTAEMLDFEYAKKTVAPVVKKLAEFRNMNPEIFNRENAVLSGMGSNFWLSDGMGMFSSADSADEVLRRKRIGDDSDLDRNELRSLATSIAVKGDYNLFSTSTLDGEGREVFTLNHGRVNQTFMLLFNDLRGKRTSAQMTPREIWRTGILARNDLERENARTANTPMVSDAEIRERIKNAKISDLASFLYIALQERRDKAQSIRKEARMFLHAYEISDLPFLAKGPVRMGKTMDEAFRRDGSLPSDFGVGDMLMQMGKSVAKACAFTGTLHSMATTTNMYGRPNYVLVPTNVPEAGEHFSDQFWGNLAQWYLANFPGLKMDYRGDLSGRANCKRVTEALTSQGFVNSNNYSKLTDFSGAPGSGSITGIAQIHCLNPRAVSKKNPHDESDPGTREMDDQHSALTDAGGGEAMCYMKTLCGLRHISTNPNVLAKFYDKILLWSKTNAVMFSGFFRVATGFESPVAASGFIQTVLGGGANILGTTGRSTIATTMNEWLHEMSKDPTFAALSQDSKSVFARFLFGDGPTLKDKGLSDSGYQALSITDVMHAWESNDPGLAQLKRLCVRCGITLTSPGEYDFFEKDSKKVEAFADKLAKQYGKLVGKVSPEMEEPGRLMMSGFLRGITTDDQQRNFTHIMNITKLAVASQILMRLRNQAVMENRYFDPVKELRKVGNYINEEIGGVNPLAHAFATPNAQKWLNRLMFSWQWTMGSWSAAGGTVLSNALLGGEATNPALRGFFLGRWLRMAGWINQAVPAFGQLLVMAYTRAMYGMFADDDDKKKYRPDLDRWLKWSNEARGRDSIDLTPLLNVNAMMDEKMFGGALRKAKRGEYGRLLSLPTSFIPMTADLSKPYERRTYQHFGKQLSEVVRWGESFEEALAQAWSKMALPLQNFAVYAFGRHPLTGFETKAQAANLTGSDKIAANVGGWLFSTFAPFSASGMMNFQEAGGLVLLGPTKRGLGEWMATQKLEAALAEYARNASTVRGYRSKKLIRTRANIDEILADAARNGLDPEALLKTTTAKVLGDFYSEYWNSLPRDPDAKASGANLRALSAMRALGAKTEGVKKSLEGRSRRYGSRADTSTDPGYQWGIKAANDMLGPSATLISDPGALRQDSKGGNVFDDAGLPATVFGMPVSAPKQRVEREGAPTTVFGIPVNNRKAPDGVDVRKALASDELPQAIFGNPVTMTEHPYFDEDPRVPGFYEVK